MPQPDPKPPIRVEKDLSEVFHRLVDECTRRGYDPETVVAIVTDAISRAAEPGRLPPAESAFLRDFGGVDDSAPSLGESYPRTLVNTAAREAKNYLTVEQLAHQLGVDTSLVRRRASSGSLLSEELGGKLLLPAWQITASSDGSATQLPHLAAVIETINAHSTVRQSTWVMTTPQPELKCQGKQVTPTEWLVTGGQVAPVLEILSTEVGW